MDLVFGIRFFIVLVMSKDEVEVVVVQKYKRVTVNANMIMVVGSIAVVGCYSQTGE